MKDLIKYGLLAVPVMLAASCLAEKQDISGAKTILSSLEARVSEMPQTKAILTDESKIKWELGDELLVFSDASDPVYFINENGDGNTFSCTTPIEGTTFYACFPPTAYVTPEDNRLVSFYLNVFTQCYGGKNPSIGAPMIAKSNGSVFEFKQAAGILHFALTGSGELVSATLRGNQDEPLGGNAFLNISDSVPVIKFPSTGSIHYAMFSPDSPVKLSPDEAYDIYFILPPMTFENGFSLELDYGGETLTKSTHKQVTISRAIITNYTLDADKLTEEAEDLYTKERNALIAFYNAMNGPNWKDNSNWCSDKPVTEWSGINYWPGSDLSDEKHVVSIYMADNNLCGTLPAEMADLTKLLYLRLNESSGSIIDYENVSNITSLENLFIGPGDFYSPSMDDIYNCYTTIPENIGNLQNLTFLEISGVKGVIPESLFSLSRLKNLELRNAMLDGSLPSGFGRLSSLEDLYIHAYTKGSPHQLSGPIPLDLYDCTSLKSLAILDTEVSGELSPKIGNLSNLHDLRLANNELSGPLPAELASLHFEMSGSNTPIALAHNNFTGKVPDTFGNWPIWDLCWGYIIPGNDGLDYSDCAPGVPVFTVSTIDGGSFNSSSVKDNTLTVFFQWTSWCPYSPEVVPILKSLYDDYHGDGLEIVSWSYESIDQIRSSVAGLGIPGICFMNESRGGDNTIGIQMWPYMLTPDITVFDSNGKMVFHSFGLSNDFAPFVRSCFGEGPDPAYTSSDYSADGTVHILQTASEGAGIDIVMMGDAYSDRLIADGTYDDVMNRAMEAFFAEEPYKSYRNLFNVSYVDVVSKNEHYQGETALDTWYGEGTTVGGDDGKVLQYARKVLTPAGRSTDEVLVIVMMNRDYYAGTCYMTGRPEGDYGCGYSIAYLPVSSSEATFGGTVRHEAGGHGFAKLADEYSYGGTIPQDEIESFRNSEPYGWWRNVDFTSDATAVKWADFLSDNRYSSEGLGVFEGACTYSYGAYRPTDDSIMKQSNYGFNAPSCYAIWYRINKLAYGDSWTGTREDFVTWDLAHRNAAPRRQAKAKEYEGATLPPLGRPVFRFEQ